MATWLKIEPVHHHRVSIAGRVTDSQTNRPIDKALVKITDAPQVFVNQLVTLAKLVRLPDEALEEFYTVLDDPGKSRADKLHAAQIIMDDPRVDRALALKRTDRTDTVADGHFHFLDLPSGDYTLMAVLPGAGTRYATAQKTVTVSSADTDIISGDMELRPTTVKGQLTDVESAEPILLAKVRVKGGGEYAYSDAAGQYRLTALEANEKQDRIIQVTAQGYLSKVKAVSLRTPGTEEDSLNFVLERG